MYTDIDFDAYFAQFAENEGADYQLIDVREVDEFAGGHLPTALNIPLGDVLARADEIATDKPIILVCARGGRSAMAAENLATIGYTDLYNLQGGTMGWINAGYPTEK